MIDALISLAALFVLFLACVAVLEGGIQVQKWWFMRRTEKFVKEQERQWLTEQQQRRQHQRAVRNSNN